MGHHVSFNARSDSSGLTRTAVASANPFSVRPPAALETNQRQEIQLGGPVVPKAGNQVSRTLLGADWRYGRSSCKLYCAFRDTGRLAAGENEPVVDGPEWNN